MFADDLITFGVSALRPVNDQYEEQGYILLRCDEAIEKISRLVEAGHHRHGVAHGDGHLWRHLAEPDRA